MSSDIKILKYLCLSMFMWINSRWNTSPLQFIACVFRCNFWFLHRVKQDPRALEAPVVLRDPEGTQEEWAYLDLRANRCAMC